MGLLKKLLIAVDFFEVVDFVDDVVVQTGLTEIVTVLTVTQHWSPTSWVDLLLLTYLTDALADEALDVTAELVAEGLD